jgi:hypothetical protein
VLSSDRSLYADDDRVTLQAEVRTPDYEPAAEATVWATLAGAGGGKQTIELTPAPDHPGLYQGQLSARAPGLHRVEVHAQRGGADLGHESLALLREDGVAEGFHPAQDADRLRRLAQATGGRYWTLDDVAGLPAEITYSGAGITVRETLDLWDMPAVFLAALLLRVGEWIVRRRGGRI